MAVSKRTNLPKVPKKRFSVKCVCGKTIVGFSLHHAKANLKLHCENSQSHQNILKQLKKYGVKISKK